MDVVMVKFGGVQGGVDGHKISFSLDPVFTVLSRRVSSLIWVVLGKRLAVVGEIVCRKAKLVRRK